MFGFGHLALRESFNKKLTLTVLLITISQFNFGFDQQGFAATQAMDAFAKQFGVFDKGVQEWILEPVWLSFFNGFNYLGQAAGAFVYPQLLPRYCLFLKRFVRLNNPQVLLLEAT